MPLDLLDRTDMPSTKLATNVSRMPKLEAREVAAESPSNATASSSPISGSLARNDRLFPDGVRILDPIAPIERAKYYSHSLNSRLQVLQAWEGAVTNVDVDGGYFTARLYDLTNPKAEVSEAEFDLSDVSSNDLDLLNSGGVFRWMIGYRHYTFGQRERVSAIVFRRLPTWNEDDMELAMSEATRLADTIAIR